VPGRAPTRQRGTPISTTPALLVPADFSVLSDGTLNGAMAQDDADKAMSPLAHGRRALADPRADRAVSCGRGLALGAPEH